MTAEVVPVWGGPAPTPIGASMVAQRLDDLANGVPAGKWVGYGDLADAYTSIHGENMVARGVASALSLLPTDRHKEERQVADPQHLVDKWPVPWHRIRLTDGHAISRGYGILHSDDHVNRMLAAEGGTIRHGAATDSCRFNLAASVRSDFGKPVPPRDLTDEQRDRLRARAKERAERLNRG
jgi:alkylated DNA nucleotide flippase Atl1